MAEISFYELSSTPLERALFRLLEKARSEGHRMVVKASSKERVERLNTVLWTYEDASFLPHGSVADGNPQSQPIWLTEREENPNGADLLFLVDGAECEALSGFPFRIDLFEGRDEAAVEEARRRWRRNRGQGHTLSFWQESPSGWTRKA